MAKTNTTLRPESHLSQSESKIQQDIVRWYINTYCLDWMPNQCIIFTIPNQNQHHLTHIGVLSGVSDLMICHFGNWICVEVKEEKGVQSKAQKDFEIRVKRLGTAYYLVRSLYDFKQVVENL